MILVAFISIILPVLVCEYVDNIISCYTVYTEKQRSEGRVDCIIETPRYIYILEFKLDGQPMKPFSQIEDRGYVRPYEADSRKLFKIGVSFSSDTGMVSDWKLA